MPILSEPLFCSPGMILSLLPHPPAPGSLSTLTGHPSNSSHFRARLSPSQKDSLAQSSQRSGGRAAGNPQAQGCHRAVTGKGGQLRAPSPYPFWEKHEPDKKQPRAEFQGTQSWKWLSDHLLRHMLYKMGKLRPGEGEAHAGHTIRK